MRITDNFKTKLTQAKEDGFENIYSIIGAYKATTYVRIDPIDWLLNQPNGTMIGSKHQGRWSGTPNLNHVPDNAIQYRELMSNY